MGEFFTTFGVNWKLLVIQAVNFGVLLGALSYLLYTPVMKMLDERKALVAKGVQDAAEAKERLATAAAESRTLVGKAALEAEGIVSHAREHAVTRGADIERVAKERADVIVKEAAERAEALKVAAMKESDAAIAKAAVLAAEKILQGKN